MWFGWNSNRVKNNHQMQAIEYLPQINSSPTSHSVVALTLEMALQLADECNQKYLLVTYDLAICKIAMAIQVVERDRFDRLFIMLGIHIVLFKLTVTNYNTIVFKIQVGFTSSYFFSKQLENSLMNQEDLIF
jgi:hypothetical protein